MRAHHSWQPTGARTHLDPARAQRRGVVGGGARAEAHDEPHAEVREQARVEGRAEAAPARAVVGPVATLGEQGGGGRAAEGEEAAGNDDVEVAVGGLVVVEVLLEGRA